MLTESAIGLVENGIFRKIPHKCRDLFILALTDLGSEFYLMHTRILLPILCTCMKLLEFQSALSSSILWSILLIKKWLVREICRLCKFRTVAVLINVFAMTYKCQDVSLIFQFSKLNNSSIQFAVLK